MSAPNYDPKAVEIARLNTTMTSAIAERERLGVALSGHTEAYLQARKDLREQYLDAVVREARISWDLVAAQQG